MNKSSPSKTIKRLRAADSQEYVPPSKCARISKQGMPTSTWSMTTRRSKYVSHKDKPEVPLATLYDLPAELLLEIFSLVPTKGLLSLSTVCRALRNVLADGSEQCKVIWQRSRKAEIVPIPSPPEGMTEEQWATFLYGSTCQMCGASGRGAKLTRIYTLHRRVCRACMGNNVIRGADQPYAFARGLPFASLKVLELIPSTHKFLDSTPPAQYWNRGYYWISDIVKMSKLLARDFPEVFFSEKMPEDSPEFTEFCNMRIEYVEKAREHSAKCCIWESELDRELERLKLEEKEKQAAKAEAEPLQTDEPETQMDIKDM